MKPVLLCVCFVLPGCSPSSAKLSPGDAANGSSVASSASNSGNEKNKIHAADKQLTHFQVALDAFHQDVGRYPERGLLELVQPSQPYAGWRGPYLESVPKDPWGHDYVYACPGRHNPGGYDLSCQTAAGNPNGMRNWNPALNTE
jgi:type II secretion system protein G